MGRKLAGTSVLSVLVVAAIVMGTSIAWAADAHHVQTIDGADWQPLSNGPDGHEYSGIAHLGGDEFIVVDTNFNDEEHNGWILNGKTHTIQNVATGVDEPTGVDYDPVNDRMFISDDDGTITIITGFNTENENRQVLMVGGVNPDTEDPVWDRAKQVLFWLDGPTLNWRDPGPDNVFDADDDTGSFSIASLGVGDYESMAWDPDPDTGNLLIGDRDDDIIHEVFVHDHESGIFTAATTIDASNVNGLFDISGLGVGLASGGGAPTLWAVSRDGKVIVEMTFDGTVPPPPPDPTTTLAEETTTTTLLEETTTTLLEETTTTSPEETTTTKQSITTTTGPSATTTTTKPGSTTTTTQPSSPPSGGFHDTQGHTFQTSIEWLADQGITQGCNPPANDMFCPDAKVTRGQMATFLVRAFGYSDSGSGNYFSDTAGSVFNKAIDRLRVAGITEGCNPPANDRFCPDDYVTRGQMAAFLVRAFKFSDAGSGGYFTDTGDSVFKIAIDRLRVAGVTQGCNPPANDNYCPDDLVTRGQMSAFLKRGFGQ